MSARVGFSTVEVSGPRIGILEEHVIGLPQCCPVSQNPRAGSTLRLTYEECGRCLEVYSICDTVRGFVGGWDGNERYPAERSMEGMIATLAQMAADVLGVPVTFRADLVLDVGGLRLSGRAEPRH